MDCPGGKPGSRSLAILEALDEQTGVLTPSTLLTGLGLPVTDSWVK